MSNNQPAESNANQPAESTAIQPMTDAEAATYFADSMPKGSCGL